MRHCNLCGRAVAPNEYRLFTRQNRPESRGLTVCAECERTQPRCAVCQTPMPSRRVSVGICADCVREGLRCRSCGDRVNGKFLMVNGNDGPYCDKCYRQYAKCDLCSAPVGEGAVTYADGRVVCARCHQTALADPTEAEAVFEQVRHILDDVLGMRLAVRPRLALVDHTRLVELARLPAAETGHDSEKALGLFMRAGRKRFVYLQENLPRILFIQVAAHEFAHAWQGENCPSMSDPLLREGFAEWAAYRVLLAFDAKKKAAQMLARRDLYGQGLQRVVEIEQQRGVAGLLQYCRTA